MVVDAEQILLSIAIPTKNRQNYLIDLLDEILLSTRNNFEIVIRDNSDDDSLSSYISAKNDDRIRYRYHGDWVSVVENCDAAVSDCSGDYVCMLGDDDGIMLDESLAMLSDAKLAGADAVMSRVLLYNWPDLSHHSISNFGGKLFLKPARSGKGPRNLLTHARGVVSRSGALGLEGLPCVYQGFVDRGVLSMLRSATGSYFPGPSPDMANAIGICSLLDRVWYVSQTLIIAGHSKSSAGGRGARRQHHGAIDKQSHLPSNTAASWNPQIPFFWSGPTIYAQSLHSAMQRTGVTTLGKPGDACLYAACLVFESAYAQETWKAIRNSAQPFWFLFPRIAYYVLVITIRRAYNYLFNVLARLWPRQWTVASDSISETIGIVRAKYFR